MIKSKLREYKILMGLWLVAASAFFLNLWLNFSGSIQDLGIGGFAGAISTGFTIFLLESLQERRETLRLMPKRIVAYEDVRLLAARIITFWNSAYMSSVPGELPKTIAELVSTSSIQKIRVNLDMNSAANVTPAQSWWTFLPSQLRELRDLAEMILHRHSEILDPAAYLSVNNLAHKAMNPDYSNMIRASDREFQCPRPQVLGNYIILVDEYFPSLLRLVEWLIEEAKDIEEMSDQKVNKLGIELGGVRPAGIPSCMIDPKLLLAQIEAYRRHQNQYVEN